MIKFLNQFRIKRCSTFNKFPLRCSANLTKLVKKLQKAEIGQEFKTSFDKKKKIFTFARLDYNRLGITLDRKFDPIDELILNAIYSIGRECVPEDDGDGEYEGNWQPVFTARKILQHIFGNVPDHFQKETVEVIEQHIEDLSYMKITLDLKDRLGNDAYVKVNGEKYHPVWIKDSLLDVSILCLRSSASGKKFGVYKLNRKSPLFIYAEKLKQIASWSVTHMAVPCRKSIQNAVITNHLLTKISLVKNENNHYLNTGILFDTLYEELGLDASTRKKKMVIRNNIKQMFDYWVQTKLLTSYEFVKKGQAFYKIMFNVNLSGVPVTQEVNIKPKPEPPPAPKPNQSSKVKFDLELFGNSPELEEKLDYVHNNPEIYFTQKAKNGGYICPVCGNGSGKDGTGVLLIKGQTFRYKCFKCGTSGDVINFYAAEHHLNNAEALQQMFNIYGLETPKSNFRASEQSSQKSEKTVEEITEDLQLENVIAEDIAKAGENLNQTSYFKSRGISEEITTRYGCGFLKNWVHPKKRGDKKIIPSDRAIIPTGVNSYVARAVDENKIPKMKVGTSNIFNVDVLRNSEKNVAVVEGEFDALSIIEVGNDAIALGSTTNVDKFLNWLKENNIKPKKPLILDLDDDDAGKSAMKKLSKGLKILGIKYFCISLKVEECKDQNESLVKFRDKFTDKVKKIPQMIEELKKNARRNLSDSAKVKQWELNLANARDAIPTGWKSLDEVLDGGLYEGLYVIPGATGTGKTAFALQMAYQMAEQNKDVLYISLEMGEEEIYARHISRISYQQYGDTAQAKTVHSIIQEKKTVSSARQKFEEVGLYLRTVCGVGSIDADDIRKIVENYEYELDTLPVVIVDYLQILKAHDPHMTDKQAVDYNVLKLKQLSRDYKIPVIALASMNRTSYSDVISMVSIKESGAIEYTSDVCIGLQMAEMDKVADSSQKQGQKEKAVRELKAKTKHDMQAVILKQRNGAIGAEIPFTYCAMFNHFEDKKSSGVSAKNFFSASNL